MDRRPTEVYPGDDPLFDLHYRFSHRWIPDRAARQGLAFLDGLQGPRGARILREGWGEVAGSLGFLELPPLPPDVLVPSDLQGGGVWFALPAPRFVTGVHFQALVPRFSRLEVYQAERTMGNRALLCGWGRTAEGSRHVQHADLADATPEAFLEGLRRLRARSARQG